MKGASGSSKSKRAPEVPACAPIVQGTACDPASAPNGCTIDEYIYCACTGCTGAGPCTDETEWRCAAGFGSDCPKLLPNDGQRCTEEAMCTYRSCSTGNLIGASCNGSVWRWDQQVCAQ